MASPSEGRKRKQYVLAERIHLSNLPVVRVYSNSLARQSMTPPAKQSAGLGSVMSRVGIVLRLVLVQLTRIQEKAKLYKCQECLTGYGLDSSRYSSFLEG